MAHNNRLFNRCLFLLTILFINIFLSSFLISASGSIHIKNNTSWDLIKQEKDVNIYIDDKYSKTPLICEIYPDAKNKNDLPSRNIYTSKDKKEVKDLLVSKISSITLEKNKKEKQKTIQKKIDDQWADCYQVESGDIVVQKGDNSTIFIYQEYSMIEYVDDSVTTSFILQKFNGASYSTKPENIWVKNESDCNLLGKQGLCFGAIDNSMNESELADYRYIINSTSSLVLIENYIETNQSNYTYPLFYTYQKTGDWKETRQEYSFDDICKKSYADCQWIKNENSAIITFVSDKYIDPDITNVSACATLDQNDTYYQLNQSINSTGSCITITANNVTLDGAANLITYGTNSSNSYGVYVSSSNGSIIQNVRINESSFFANGRYGIYVSSSRNTNINNVNITTNGLTSYGIFAGISPYTFIGSSMISTTGSSGYGVYFSNSPNSTLYTSNITSSSSSVNTVYLQTSSDCNLTSNNITANALNAVGIYVTSSSARTKIISNNILTKGGNGYGIYIASGLSELIERNSIETRGANAYGLLISTSANNNILRSNILNVTSGARISIDTSINVILENNTIINRKPAYFDISIGAACNNMTFINQAPLIQNYSFVGAGSRINIENTDFGIIKFNTVINGTGINMSSDIQILNNSAYINSSANNGFNKSANVTLYNIGNRGFITPIILRDNVICTTCYNYTSLTAQNVTFNVTGWSNYSIGDTPDTTNPNATILNPTNGSSYYIDQNFSVNLTDNTGLKNATLHIYNSTNSEINRTNFSSIYGSLQSQVGIVVSLADGIYTWFWDVFDTSGNSFTTTNNTMTKLSYTPPIIIFNSQIPSDLNLTNFLGPAGVNITYNVTDLDNDLNVSTIKLYYKSNSSTSNVMYYQNGTAHIGFFVDTYISNISSTFNWNLLDNAVLPGTYNFGEITMENTVHVSQSLSSANSYASVELLNVSNTTQYGFFEMMTNRTAGVQALRFYYCNSSYVFGVSNAPAINANCVNFFSDTNATYNHRHTANSAHKVIPFPINITTGTISNIKVTPTSYFMIRGATNWNYYYINNLSRTNAIRTTANNGISWTSQNYTIDSHLHQFTNTSSLYYYACANDTLNLTNCSSVRQDLFEVGGLPPSSPSVYSPQATTYYYGETISINYTASESPNSYPIIYYNISLLNENLSFNQTIIANNSNNLGYLYTPIAFGNFTILVTAYDSLGQSSSGYSEIFAFSQAITNLSLTSSAGWNINHTTITTINGSGCPSQITCNLYENGLLVSNPKTQLFSAGNYSYVYNTTGNANYTQFTINETLVVNKSSQTAILNFSLTSPIEYGTNLTAYCNGVLYRDDINVSSEIGVPVILSLGVHNYSCQLPELQNYTYSEQNDTFTVTNAFTTTTVIVSPASPITYGTASNFSCFNSVNLPTTLFINGTNKTSEMGLYVIRPIGNYTVNCTAYDNENYSGSSDEVNYTILIPASIDYVFTPTENTYLNSTPKLIKSFCYDISDNMCGTDVNCTLSIFYQNSSILVNKELLTRTPDYYFYNLSSSQTNITGNYNGLVRCIKGSEVKTSFFTYSISVTGNNVNDDVNNIWNVTNRSLTYTQDVTNYNQINEGVWNYTHRNLTENISYEVWNYYNRTTTYTPDMTNYTLIGDTVWNYQGIIAPNILDQFMISVWSYTGAISSNILAQFVNLISAAVWSTPNRTLTDFNFTVNATINNSAVAGAVWSYTNKTVDFATTGTTENVTNVATVDDIANMGHTYVGGTEYIDGENGKIAIRLIRGTGALAFVETGANCTVSITYPNTTYYIFNDTMIELGNGAYTYNFIVPPVLGIYPYFTDCYIEDRKYFSLDDFHVYENNYSTIPNMIWNNDVRNLTYYEVANLTNVTVNINSTKVAQDVWNYNGTVNKNIIIQFTDNVYCKIKRFFNSESDWEVSISSC